MNDFLFPEASPKELGVLIFLSRKSFISALPRTVGPASSEMSVMQAVISLGKELHVQIVPKKNGEISSRNAKLILQKCCQLSSDEANMLLRGLDADSSLEVSPYEMKRWLFPESLSTQQGHRLVHHSSSDAIVSPKSSPEKNIKGTIFKFAEYSSLAQRLRNALHDFDKRSVEEAQSYAAQLFSRCEGSLEDALTHEEFQHFIWESELDLFRDIEDEAAKQLYATTLIEQIDINRDGSISFRELRDFIWTRQDQRELGLIIQQAREAVLAFAGPRITTESTDEVIVDIVAAFAKSFPCNHDFTCLRQGHVVDSRNLRSAFTSLLVRDRGDRTPSAIDKEEALSLMLTIDANGDAVVSGTELRSWLFPNIASYTSAPPAFLAVHPVHPTVYIHMTAITPNGTHVPIGSVRASDPLDFNNFGTTAESPPCWTRAVEGGFQAWRDCSFACTAYVVPGATVSDEELQSGKYYDALAQDSKSDSVNATITKAEGAAGLGGEERDLSDEVIAIKVSEFTVTKSQGLLSPGFIDTGVDLVELRFFNDSQALGPGYRFSGIFSLSDPLVPPTSSSIVPRKSPPSSAPSGLSSPLPSAPVSMVALNAVTNEDGICQVAIPPGTVSSATICSPSGELGYLQPLHIGGSRPTLATAGDVLPPRQLDMTILSPPVLRIHPPHPRVFLDVTLALPDGTLSYLGSIRASDSVDIATLVAVSGVRVLPPLYSYQCKAYIVPGQVEVDENDVQRGTFGESGDRKGESIFLREVTVAHSHGVLTPQFIDTGIALVDFSITMDGRPMPGGSMVTGWCGIVPPDSTGALPLLPAAIIDLAMTQTDGATLLRALTDAHGCCCLPVPPGGLAVTVSRPTGALIMSGVTGLPAHTYLDVPPREPVLMPALVSPPICHSVQLQTVPLQPTTSRPNMNLLNMQAVSSGVEPSPVVDVNIATAFTIPTDKVALVGKGFADSGQPFTLSTCLVRDGHNGNDALTIEGVGMAMPSGQVEVKLQVVVNSSTNPDAMFDENLYGMRTVHVGAPDATLIASYELEVRPETGIRYPAKIEYLDAITKLPMDLNISAILTGSDGAILRSLSGRRSIALPMDLPDGTISVAHAADGYERTNQKFVKYKSAVNDFSKVFLSPILLENEMRVVLSWNKQPRDLDLHCTDSKGDHVYFSNRSAGGIGLDVDVTSGCGPETITLRPKIGVKYCFFVHHYSSDGLLSTSGAWLKVYGLRGVDVIRIPGEASVSYESGHGFWDVFAIESDGSVRLVNKIARGETASSKRMF